jgi:hypothetical protein
VIRIDTMRNSYFVPRDHSRPERLRYALDDTATRRLPGACAAVLGGVLNADHPSVWFIRNLEVDLTIDVAGFDEDYIARLWAGQISGKLIKALAAGPDGGDVISFDSRVDYIAAFVWEAALGGNARRWYFTSMQMLKSLPLSAQIGEALVREPEQTRAAVALLEQQQRLDLVLSALTERDAETILYACGSVRAEAHAGVAAIVRFLAATGQRRLAATKSAKAALLIAARSGFVCPSAALLALLRYVADPAPENETFLREIAPDDPAAWLAEIRDTLIEEVVVDELRIIETMFAGAWLLLPAALNAAPAEVLESAELRLQLFSKCMGRDEAMDDPGMQFLCGIPLAHARRSKPVDQPGPRDEEADRIDPLPVLRAFVSRLVAFHDATPEFLYENLLAGPGSIRIAGGWIEAHLPRVPLEIVLRISGADGRECEPPWLPMPVRLRLPEP